MGSRINFVAAAIVAAGGLAAAPAASASASITHPAVTAAQAVRDTAGAYTLTWTADPALSVKVYASTDPALRPAHRTLVATTSQGTAQVTGLDGLSRWYFTFQAAGQAGIAEAADRTLAVEGVANARDIGGYPAAGGLVTRWGTVFRSATLSAADATGIQELEHLGLHEVIDFRNTADIARQGADPVLPGVTEVSDPIGNPDQAWPTPPNDPPSSGNLTEDGYRQFVNDPYLRAQFAAALRRLATPGDRPLLLHCTGGDQRTGWMTVTLLRILGVPESVVEQDYLRSPNASAVYLATGDDEVRLQYGTWNDYVSKGLGVSKAEIALLKVQLLTLP